MCACGLHFVLLLHDHAVPLPRLELLRVDRALERLCGGVRDEIAHELIKERFAVGPPREPAELGVSEGLAVQPKLDGALRRLEVDDELLYPGCVSRRLPPPSR